jgi:hypothetical protein
VPSAGPSAGARLAALREWAESTVDEPEDAGNALTLVPSLVDEGSEEESATLRRIAELRAVIDDREVAAGVRWDDPAGLPLTLLVSDAFGGAPGRRALARRVLHDRLLAVGQALAAETDEPDPQEQTVTVEGQTVRVRTGGPVQADVDAAHRAIDARYPAPPSKAWQRYAWFGAGVVALGLALAVPLGLAVVLVLLALIFAFVGVRRIFADRLEVNEQQERLRAARERADKAIEAQRQSLVATCRRLDEARRQAPADLSALRAALTGELLTSE